MSLASAKLIGLMTVWTNCMFLVFLIVLMFRLCLLYLLVLFFFLSDSGFASLSSSLSSSSTLPTGTPSASSALPSSSFSSSFLSSSLGSVPSCVFYFSLSSASSSSSTSTFCGSFCSFSCSCSSSLWGFSSSSPGFSSYFSLILPSFSFCSFFFLVASAAPPSFFPLPSSAPLSAPSCFFLASRLFLFRSFFVSGFRCVPGSDVGFF